MASTIGLPNSGDATEVGWVNTALGLSGSGAYATGDLTKTDTPEDGGWKQLYSDYSGELQVVGAYAYDFKSEHP